jgi:hypothetical protein
MDVHIVLQTSIHVHTCAHGEIYHVHREEPHAKGVSLSLSLLRCMMPFMYGYGKVTKYFSFAPSSCDEHVVVVDAGASCSKSFSSSHLRATSTHHRVSMFSNFSGILIVDLQRNHRFCALSCMSRSMSLLAKDLGASASCFTPYPVVSAPPPLNNMRLPHAALALCSSWPSTFSCSILKLVTGPSDPRQFCL